MRRRISNPVLVATLCLGACLSGGCPFVSFFAASFAPRAKTDAQFELPRDKHVLVFPDDLAYRLQYPPLKRILAEKLNKHLLQHHLAAGTVEYEKLAQLKHRVGDRWTDVRPGGMGVAQVTRELQADLAIYVDIREFRLKDRSGDPVWKARFTVLVKVVGADGRRLWPTDRKDGRELSVETPLLTDDSEGFGITLTDDVADRMADKIAKLFYRH